MNEYTKAQKEIIKALRAINNAATLFESMPEYTNNSSVFHADIVSKYNRLITCAITLNGVQL